MPVISVSIPTLANGVSQQPAALRLTSQCELLEHAYTSIVKGVVKRQPLRHLAKLTSSTTGDCYVHTINRDGTELYSVIIENGNIQVYSLVDGSARTVNYPQGTAYLAASDPKTQFAATTVADYTFIVNRTITVASLASSASPARPHECIFYCRSGNYGQAYTVNVTPGTTGSAVSASYTTSMTDNSTIATTNIATQLYNSLHTSLNGVNGFTVTLQGSLIYVSNSTQDFSISASDGSGDTSIVAIKGNMQEFADLPQNGVNGFVVKITGNDQNPYEGYYVTYQGNGNSGVWVECVGPGSLTELDATTMPWQLVREANGSFTFQTAAWEARSAGDDNSCPMPSCVGNTINNVLFYENRLGFLSGEHVIFSKDGSFFDLFPDSAVQLVDTDRIDVGAIHSKVSILWDSTPYQSAMLLFSKQTQFIMDDGGSGVFSPKTISIRPLTEYENMPDQIAPVYTGRVVYFAVPRGSYVGVRELQSLINAYNTVDAPEITDHVPEYIPDGAFKMAVSSNDDTMAILTTGDQSTIYIYKWFWDGSTKAQSAWCRWPLPATDTVLNVDFVQNTMYVVIQRSDGIYLEWLDLQIGAEDNGFTFQVNLDRLLFLTGVYNAGTNTTTWTLPYNETNPMQVIVGPAWSSPGACGFVLNTQQPTQSTVTAAGNWTLGPCYVGRPYTMRLRLSTQYVREYVKGGGFTTTVANQDSRIQLNRMYMVYEETGYLRAEVTPIARPMNTYVFSGRQVGIAGATVGSVATPTGRFTFPVLAQSTKVQIDLVNDTYLPCRIQAGEWQGKFFTPSQRQ